MGPSSKAIAPKPLGALVGTMQLRSSTRRLAPSQAEMLHAADAADVAKALPRRRHLEGAQQHEQTEGHDALRAVLQPVAHAQCRRSRWSRPSIDRRQSRTSQVEVGTGIQRSSSDCCASTSAHVNNRPPTSSIGSKENEALRTSTMPSVFMSAHSVPCEVPMGVHSLCSRCSQRGCQPRVSAAATAYQKASIERENSKGSSLSEAPAQGGSISRRTKRVRKPRQIDVSCACPLRAPPRTRFSSVCRSSEARTRKPFAGACSSHSTMSPPRVRGAVQSMADPGLSVLAPWLPTASHEALLGVESGLRARGMRDAAAATA